MSVGSKRSWLVGLGIGVLAVAAVPVWSGQGSRDLTVNERIDRLEQEVEELQTRAGINHRHHHEGHEIKRVYTNIGAVTTLRMYFNPQMDLILANNSKWIIAPDDKAIAGQWRPQERIQIEANENQNFPYLLINADRQQQIFAQYDGRVTN